MDRDDRGGGGRGSRGGSGPLVWTLCRQGQPAVVRLQDGSREAMGWLLRGFCRLGPVVGVDRLRREWPEVLRLVEPVLRRRALRALRRDGADPATEELAVACLYHARESLAGSFVRIERTEFRSTDALLASLHLHAELVLLRRMAPYEPPPVDLPTVVGHRS